jgi:hypothetical protein
MKLDAYSEIYLWNKNVDALIRVLQRMEMLGIHSKEEMKVHELRLEEIRSALNADFAEAMFARERSDHLRLNERRSAWEQRNPRDALQ